jgi:hypothetical protein
VTGGTDALGDVVVQLDVDGRRVTGRGVATDVSRRARAAYLAAVEPALAEVRRPTGGGGRPVQGRRHGRRDPGRRDRPEVVGRGPAVLDAVGRSVELVEFDLGAERYLRTGESLPDDELARLRGLDAILLGAVGDPGSARRPRTRPAAPDPVRARPVREPAADRRYPGVETLVPSPPRTT